MVQLGLIVWYDFNSALIFVHPVHIQFSDPTSNLPIFTQSIFSFPYLFFKIRLIHTQLIFTTLMESILLDLWYISPPRLNGRTQGSPTPKLVEHPTAVKFCQKNDHQGFRHPCISLINLTRRSNGHCKQKQCRLKQHGLVHRVCGLVRRQKRRKKLSVDRCTVVVSSVVSGNWAECGNNWTKDLPCCLLEISAPLFEQCYAFLPCRNISRNHREKKHQQSTKYKYHHLHLKHPMVL